MPALYVGTLCVMSTQYMYAVGILREGARPGRAVAAVPGGLKLLNNLLQRAIFSRHISPALVSKVFDDNCNSLPAANAGRRESILAFAPAQLIQQSDQQPRASRAKRMSQRDRSAIHVDLLAIEPQLLFHCKVLRCECLVHFDQVKVIEREPGLLQRDPGRGHRPRAHDLGIHAGDTPTHDSTQGLEVAPLRFSQWHDDECR